MSESEGSRRSLCNVKADVMSTVGSCVPGTLCQLLVHNECLVFLQSLKIRLDILSGRHQFILPFSDDLALT